MKKLCENSLFRVVRQDSGVRVLKTSPITVSWGKDTKGLWTMERLGWDKSISPKLPTKTSRSAANLWPTLTKFTHAIISINTDALGRDLLVTGKAMPHKVPKIETSRRSYQTLQQTHLQRAREKERET